MTYLTKNLAFFSNLDGMQTICAEKNVCEKTPPVTVAAVCRYDPTREKGFLKSPQTFQKPKI